MPTQAQELYTFHLTLPEIRMSEQDLDQLFDQLFTDNEFGSDEITDVFELQGVTQVEYQERTFNTAPEQDQQDQDWSGV